MNIAYIKIDKSWFFIVCGIIFIAAFYFCIVNPFRSRNIEMVKTIESVLTRLEKFENKGINIHNEKWINEEKAQLETIMDIQLKYKLFYKEQDNHLEKIFNNVYGEEIKDEALWKNRYNHEVNILLEKINKQHISLMNNALPFKRWELKIPTWKEIALEQKRFWITEELINIILKKELQADYLESINFEKIEETTINAYPELYDVIPFTLQVSVNVEKLLFLINEILKSKICFEIKTVNISGELHRLRFQESTEKSYKFDQSDQKKETQSSSVVDVILKADVLDFNIQ